MVNKGVCMAQFRRSEYHMNSGASESIKLQSNYANFVASLAVSFT